MRIILYVFYRCILVDFSGQVIQWTSLGEPQETLLIIIINNLQQEIEYITCGVSVLNV